VSAFLLSAIFGAFLADIWYTRKMLAVSRQYLAELRAEIERASAKDQT